MIDALVLKRASGGESEIVTMIRDARDGNMVAFEGLIKCYERRVLNIAYQMVGNLDDAQDVAQDVFIRLWKYLSKIRDEAKFSTWLYRLVVNASYDLLNRRRASYDQVSLDDPDGRLPELADVDLVAIDRQVASTQMRARVLVALKRLTPSERSVFVLKDLEDLDVREIAKIHEISPITVRRHLSNARQKLRQILGSLYGPEASGFEAGKVGRSEADDAT